MSITSVVLAAIGCAAFVGAGVATASGNTGWRIGLLLIAAAAPALRLFCNMLDGMLAVEGGMQSAVGDLYNELPDRISDVLFLAGAGYAAAAVPGGVAVGWAAATLALLTAYVRSLGAAQGLSNHFEGPMPKPRRMWILVVGTLLALLEPVTTVPLGVPAGTVLVAALGVIAVGSLVTVVVRLRLVAEELNRRAAS